jgi:hypothetical protein
MIKNKTPDKKKYFYNIKNKSWYKLQIIIKKQEYKTGLLKLIDIMPDIKLPNLIFSTQQNTRNIQDLDNLDSFDIYFYSKDNNILDIHYLNIEILSVKLTQIEKHIAQNSINFNRLRKLYDLVFLNYYLNLLDTKHIGHLFLDKFNAEYLLYSDPDILDIYTTKLRYKRINQNNQDNQENKILYLTNHISPDQEDYARSRKITDKYKLLICYRPNYPDEKNNLTHENYIIKINNTKLTNELDYLKYYILELIKILDVNNISIIHVTSNYWNGIAARYAAKYLKIKYIYDVRYLWEDMLIKNNHELFNSDLLNMRYNLETQVLSNASKIIVIDQEHKEQIVIRDIDPDKICIIKDPDDFDYKNMYDNL